MFEFYGIRQISYQNITDNFRINVSGKKAWVKRMLFTLLHKLGAVERIYETQVSHDRFMIDTHDILSAVQEQMYSVRGAYGKKPTHLLIGYDQMARLRCEANYPMSITVQHNGAPQDILGMKIILCPWFKGMVVLTEGLI